MTLTTNEYNALNRIASKTHMDCWFYIKTDSQNRDYIFDLEANKRIGWKRGLTDLVEGIVDINELQLTEEELRAFCDLLSKFKV